MEESAAQRPDDDQRGGVDYARIAGAGPRAAGFGASSLRRSVPFRRPRFPDIPTRQTTPLLVASAWADELLLAIMSNNRLAPSDIEAHRIRKETDKAIEVLGAGGFLDDPASFHIAPPPPDKVVVSPERFGRIRYEHLTWDSGFRPPLSMPGAQRWRAMAANRRFHGFAMRHRQGTRPWLVHLHGFSMGVPSDLAAFRSLHFHRDLGYNVLHVVLPLHGARKAGKRSGDGFVTFDYLNNVHGVAQAVWDVRRALAWARQQGSDSVSVHGVSLGAYVASVVAGIDDGVDTVIAGVPSVDLAWVMRKYVADSARSSVQTSGLLEERADIVHKVISPLSFPPKVAWERRFIYAGVADRMATPQAAVELWKHWKEPAICWYAGSHVAFALSREVRRFVGRALAPR